jgi:hypothetical protein
MEEYNLARIETLEKRILELEKDLDEAMNLAKRAIEGMAKSSDSYRSMSEILKKNT